MREHAVTDESAAQITFSTAHRSKGLEWPVVALNEDFTNITEPLLPEDERTDETNLLYVAVTLARKTLVTNALLQALLDEDAEDDREGGTAAC